MRSPKKRERVRENKTKQKKRTGRDKGSGDGTLGERFPPGQGFYFVLFSLGPVTY